MYQYQLIVMHEMAARGYTPYSKWYSRTYRGKNIPDASLIDIGTYVKGVHEIIYPEHNDKYLKECK